MNVGDAGPAFGVEAESGVLPRDVVGLYLNPPDAAVVLCVDEKTQVQALDRTAPVLPLIPGTPERRTHDYKRNGTTNLYAALDVASGNVIADLTPRHRSEEFRRFLNLIDKSVPDHLDVHVVLDNQSTHKTPSIQRWLLRHPRFHLHFTPTYSSWLKPRRKMVRRAHQQMAPPRHPPLRARTHRVDPNLDHRLERRPQALRLAQDRRRDPRQPRQLLRPDPRLRSLVASELPEHQVHLLLHHFDAPHGDRFEVTVGGIVSHAGHGDHVLHRLAIDHLGRLQRLGVALESRASLHWSGVLLHKATQSLFERSSCQHRRGRGVYPGVLYQHPHLLHEICRRLVSRLPHERPL